MDNEEAGIYFPASVGITLIAIIVIQTEARKVIKRFSDLFLAIEFTTFLQE
ncbi:hypothetical protein [Bacillus sp. 005/A4HT-01/001]|uniref:hypothetical protein n=1 Tax=Bacillus sp. 005/A4HT-01/001 TaxID=2509010 RepID=UPI00142F4F02|nr:hypothetical protein [Bacillus sp. 005/A4HT-01/001]